MADTPISPAHTSVQQHTPQSRAEDGPPEPPAHLLALIPDGIACIDRNFCISYVNAEAARIVQRSVEALLNRPWEDLFRASRESTLEAVCREVMAEGVAAHLEYLWTHLDIWLDVHVIPMQDGIAVCFRDITDRKGAELLRDTASRQLHQVLEATTDAVMSLDREGRMLFLNRRAKELLGDRGDLLGRSFFDEFPAARQGASRDYLQRAMLQGISGEFEEFYPEPLNLWLSFQLRPSGDDTIVFFRDITERRRSEQALVASEARYRVLADLNPQAIWMGSPEGHITYANQGFLDYVGLTLDELRGASWLRSFHTDDRGPVQDAWTQSLKTGEEFDLEARLIRARDRRPRWWWLRAQPVRDEAGRVLHWLGVATDIEDRRNFAETLQQRHDETERQRAELESIYQSAPVGLALFDAKDLRYLRINARQAEIIGLPPNRILGRIITDIIPLKGLRDLLENARSGHAVRNHLLEGELPTRPGEHRFWNVSYLPVHDVDGTVRAISAVVLEITNQKRAETALIQSEKLAAVGRLASSISHEINNPLEAITNLLYLINVSDDLPESVRQYVHTAQSELSRVCQIATQTLRFHRQAVRAALVSAADLVDAVLRLYQGRLNNSGIAVEARYDPRTAVVCFENDIRQVLNNLIANAIDAMRQGGRLAVRAHRAVEYTEAHPEGRRGVRITIADTGHGMSAAVKKRIFEPFYTTKDLNGTGLGLWISAGIVSRHHGRLSFRSADDPVTHGTIFSLFLPENEDPVEAPA